MKNLVVVYNGREGSSAIVSSLAKHSNVSLPIFEHLDYSNVKKKFGVEGVANLYKAIDKLLKGGVFDDDVLVDDPSLKESNDKNVVFKWRPCGDIEKISEVFLKHEVVVVVLSRRDLVNHALSKYFTNRVINEGGKVFHPQFHVKKLSKVEQDKYIDSLQSRCFEVDVGDFLEECDLYIRSKKSLLEKVSIFEENGVKVKHFYYEDFLDNKENFLSDLLSIIGLGFEDKVLESGFKKVNRNNLRDQVLNIKEVDADKKVNELIEVYSSLF